MKRKEFIKLSTISLLSIIPFSGILEKLYDKLFSPEYYYFECMTELDFTHPIGHCGTQPLNGPPKGEYCGYKGNPDIPLEVYYCAPYLELSE